MKRFAVLAMVAALGVATAGNALAQRHGNDRHDDRRGHDSRRDRDDNPPGPRGGPGTNWENPPGWRGGPGVSPDYRYYRDGGQRYKFSRVARGYYYSKRYGYWHPTYGWWNQQRNCWWDADNNPPGPRGGPGTNWENPPGWRGGPGASPDRFGRCR